MNTNLQATLTYEALREAVGASPDETAGIHEQLTRLQRLVEMGSSEYRRSLNALALRVASLAPQLRAQAVAHGGKKHDYLVDYTLDCLTDSPPIASQAFDVFGIVLPDETNPQEGAFLVGRDRGSGQGANSDESGPGEEAILRSVPIMWPVWMAAQERLNLDERGLVDLARLRGRLAQALRRSK